MALRGLLGRRGGLVSSLGAARFALTSGATIPSLHGPLTSLARGGGGLGFSRPIFTGFGRHGTTMPDFYRFSVQDIQAHRSYMDKRYRFFRIYERVHFVLYCTFAAVFLSYGYVSWKSLKDARSYTSHLTALLEEHLALQDKLEQKKLEQRKLERRSH